MRISDWSSDVCSSDLKQRMLRRMNVLNGFESVSRITRVRFYTWNNGWCMISIRFLRGFSGVDRSLQGDRACMRGQCVPEIDNLSEQETCFMFTNIWQNS